MARRVELVRRQGYSSLRKTTSLNKTAVVYTGDSVPYLSCSTARLPVAPPASGGSAKKARKAEPESARRRGRAQGQSQPAPRRAALAAARRRARLQRAPAAPSARRSRSRAPTQAELPALAAMRRRLPAAGGTRSGVIKSTYQSTRIS